MALMEAVLSGGDSAGTPALMVNEPIAAVDARFLVMGLAPLPEQEPLPFERTLSRNNLASLSTCSGTGTGFCRYDYRRGN